MPSLEENSASLFILYLVIASNFLPQTFSCRLQELMKTSMVAKHLFAFLTLLFFVVLSNAKESITPGNIALISLGIYLWFIMSTRIHLSVWIGLIILLGTIYLLQLFETNLKEKKQSSNATTIENIQLTKKILTYLSLIITVMGFIVYLGEKKLEYGNDFSIVTFILGNPKCKGFTPNYSVSNNIKGLTT
jgi:hypothetical protein